MQCRYDNTETLVRYADGELPAGEVAAVEAHLAACGVCSRRYAALGQADAMLARMPKVEPSALALLRARHALRAVIEPEPEPEIMTLSEVTDYLRVSRDELEELTPALPVFVLGSQIRVRRAALMRWIEDREQDHRRIAAAGGAYRMPSIRFKKGAA